MGISCEGEEADDQQSPPDLNSFLLYVLPFVLFKILI
jgi:hypothetical protein